MPRHGLDCPGKDLGTVSPWPGAARERGATEPNKTCQDLGGEHARRLHPYESSWRGPAEAFEADRSDSSLPELSRHHRVWQCTARSHPLATRATHLPIARMAPSD
jgi:hypothetical protein